MHELTFAESILKVVTREAAKHGADRVTVVRLVIGKMSGVDRGSLTFCLEAIAAGTMMEGAKVEVKEVAPELACKACGRSPIGSSRAPVCPKCGKPAELAPATDVYVEEIEVHDDKEDQARKKD